jgi:hypothetical protein
MAIELDACVLANAATYRDGLFTVVEAGLDSIVAGNLQLPVQVTAVARVAFSEPDTNTDYTSSFIVFNPQLQQVAWVPMAISTNRPIGADLALPYTYTAIQALIFVPSVAGLFVVRFNLDGQMQRDMKLRILDGGGS